MVERAVAGFFVFLLILVWFAVLKMPMVPSEEKEDPIDFLSAFQDLKDDK